MNQMESNENRGKLIAITTGFFSVLIAIAYLVAITILDSRGPMLPPPPEAFGMGVALFSFLF